MEIIPKQQRWIYKILLRFLEVFITVFFFTGGIVSYWRGLWAWQDNFLAPEDYKISIWLSGPIGLTALLLSIAMRFPLNIMIKFNESIGYVPLPKFFRKKQQTQAPKQVIVQKLADLPVEKKTPSPKKSRKSLEKKMKKKISDSPISPKEVATTKKNLFVEPPKAEVEEVHEKKPSIKKQDKTYDKAADILQRVVGKTTADGEDSGNEAENEQVPNKKRSMSIRNIPKLKRRPSKPAEQKNVIARTRAKSMRKTSDDVKKSNIERSNPVLNVSAASPPSDMRAKSRPQKRDSRTPQETKKSEENEEQIEEEENKPTPSGEEINGKRESFRTKNKKLKRRTFSDVFQEEDVEDELAEEEDEIGMDHLEIEKEEYPSGVIKILKCLKYLPKHGFLCVANVPLLWIVICINIFVFICRTIQYVTLKLFFLFLGFIACTFWRFFWGLWDVYTANFFYYEGLYASMIVGVLLLLPFDALNLLSAPPCLPRMYETTDSAGAIMSYNWKGFTKGFFTGITPSEPAPENPPAVIVNPEPPQKKRKMRKVRRSADYYEDDQIEEYHVSNNNENEMPRKSNDEDGVSRPRISVTMNRMNENVSNNNMNNRDPEYEPRKSTVLSRKKTKKMMKNKEQEEEAIESNMFLSDADEGSEFVVDQEEMAPEVDPNEMNMNYNEESDEDRTEEDTDELERNGPNKQIDNYNENNSNDVNSEGNMIDAEAMDQYKKEEQNMSNKNHKGNLALERSHAESKEDELIGYFAAENIVHEATFARKERLLSMKEKSPERENGISDSIFVSNKNENQIVESNENNRMQKKAKKQEHLMDFDEKKESSDKKDTISPRFSTEKKRDASFSSRNNIFGFKTQETETPGALEVELNEDMDEIDKESITLQKKKRREKAKERQQDAIIAPQEEII